MSRYGRPSDAVLVAGTHDTAKLDPLWGQGNPLYFWAQNGLICCEDGRTDGFSTISFRDAVSRTHALSQMIINSAESPLWQEERLSLQRFVCAMEVVMKKARQQGLPYDDGRSLQSIIRKRERSVLPGKAHVIAGDIF